MATTDLAGQSQMIAATVLSAAAGGPLMQVFNELGLVMALTGALGGLARSLAIRTTWREAGIGALFGALMAFGIGVLAPPLLAKMFETDLGPDAASIPVLAASGFLIGFLQDHVRRRMEEGAKTKEEPK